VKRYARRVARRLALAARRQDSRTPDVRAEQA
jgi:hypothetical protein